MTKQEAIERLAELLKDHEETIKEAEKLADMFGLEFTVHVNGVHNQYVSEKFLEEYEKLTDEEKDESDFYSEDGYAGWQSSMC